MRSRRTSVSLALSALAAGLFATVPSSAVAADPCVSGAEVREQVHALIASLRDDVIAIVSEATRTLSFEPGVTFDGPIDSAASPA